jgi:DNA segregation ATPase FtsK/SpoIIIE, S-DNA-T family
MPEFTHRPPRIQPELPVDEVVIPNPPSTETSGGQSLVQVALPLVTIIGYVFVSATGQGRSLLLLIPMGLSVVASTTVALLSYFRTFREQARLKREYDQRLAEMRKEMTAAHEIQRSFYHYNYPGPDMTLQIAGDRESKRYGLRLWERRTDDSDFGAIRLGVGTRKSTVTYALASLSETESGPQLKEALKLQEDSQYVTDVPITIPLRRFTKPEAEGAGNSEFKDKEVPGDKSIQARYAIGIAGNEIGPMYDFIRAMMTHFTAFHAPTDARLYVIGAPDAEQHWDWARWLPHTNTSRNAQGTGDQLNFEPDKSRRFWDDLQAELERRRLRAEDKDSNADPTLPHLLVVVDGLSAQPDANPMSGVQAEAAVTLILQYGPQLGASLIFIVPERAQVPSECRSVIEVERVESGISFRYAETGVNTMRFVGQADQLDPQRAEHDYARKLAPLAVRTTFGGDLARAVNLLEMHAADTVEQVPILDDWRHSRKPENSEWMRAPIGVMPANKLRELVFSADGDGSHGMIAGTTGSGKSELLLTLIVELALKYDPSVINFVLVDYKGGAAFDPFYNLPHVVDIVTNLQGSAGMRTFTALRSELNRRSKLIADTNVKHIVHYRQKGLHDSREPFPFLFIIIDEFAEMVKEQPEFKAQMDSITRLGRALGVTLITATQRPAGAVTDQMRANMKFRICLRVETMEDSRELLRRSDAAFLPPDIPGRAYVQVGNENVELIQVARAGGPYTGPDIDTEPPVIWLSRKAKEQARRAGPLEEAPALSDVLVDIMYRLSQENTDVVTQKKPWPDPLPARLPLDAQYIGDEEERNPLLPLNPAVRAWLRGEGEWKGVDWQDEAMRATIGLIDRPIRAEQLHLTLDLTRGHAAVFGASGWGKTVFLRTLIMSLAATHSPDGLQIYMLDFGGRGLDVLEALPHRGASIMPSEEERVERLLRKLDRMLQERNALLSQARADSLGAYNVAQKAAGKEPLPAVLLVIDNFAEFKENYENLLPQLIGIAREGRSYGVHLVVTAEQTSAIPGKLFSLITERFALKLADKAEYANIVGRGVPGVDDVEGRGYVAIERSPLEFQVALPVSVTAEDEAEGLDDTSKLEMLTRVMDRAWSGKRPEGIDILRALIPLRGILPELGQTQGKVLVTLGVEDLDLHPAQLDLQQRGPHFVIVGPPLSGKTTTLRAFTLALAHNYAPTQVAMVLIDFQQRFFKYGGDHTLGDLPHVLEVISEKEELTEMVEKLKYEYFERPEDLDRPEIFIMADNYDDFSNVIGAPTRATEYKDLSELARKFGPEGLHFVMCGSTAIMRSMDEMMKQVVAPRFGFGLDASESVSALGGRVRANNTEELPPGRGYIVKAGRLSLIQTAIPHDESDLEGSLDAWVKEIAAHYTERAQWWIEINPPPEPEPDEEADTEAEAAGVTAK